MQTETKYIVEVIRGDTVTVSCVYTTLRAAHTDIGLFYRERKSDTEIGIFPPSEGYRCVIKRITTTTEIVEHIGE